MVIQKIKQTLFQFKRVHKNQIAPHQPVLSEKTESLIKRKALKLMTEKEIRKLVKEILTSIDSYQHNRKKPHQGLTKFKNELLQQISL